MKFGKSAVLAAAIAMSLSGTALAASADSFSDVPKDHWSYEALDYLAKEGIIEGMGDGTFQGGRAMTRYEMAAIVAKAMQSGGGSFGDKAVLEKLANEYGQEIDTLKKQVAANTEQIQKNKEAIERVKLTGFARIQYDYDKKEPSGTASYLDKGRDRYYLNLQGDFKVSDYWNVKFQSETNRNYNGGHPRDGERGVNGYGQQTWSGHDGNIQRIWVEGHKDGLGWISIGRAWRGLGQQNVLFGTESDGIQFGVPLKGTDLTASGFWFASTGTGNKESLYGVGLWGPVGHSAGINLAYAKSSLSKGDKYSSGVPDYWYADKDDGYKLKAHYTENDTTVARDYGFVLSGYADIAKNVRFIADYSKTNADFQNSSLALRLNYRNTDLNKPGSYQLYTRYIRYGANGWLAGDDEWSSIWNGTKGWIFGVKYVPWKNVEWETFYSPQTDNYDQSGEYDRKLFRTQMDFHF